jgi:hypothetical protein
VKTYWLRVQLMEGSVLVKQYDSPSLEHDAAFVTFGGAMRCVKDWIQMETWKAESVVAASPASPQTPATGEAEP